MSCESDKCDIRKRYLIPDDPGNVEFIQSREEVYRRGQDEIHYALLYGETELWKLYTPEYFAEVKGKNHG